MVEDEIVLTVWRSVDIDVGARVVDMHYVVDYVSGRACAAHLLSVRVTLPRRVVLWLGHSWSWICCCCFGANTQLLLGRVCLSRRRGRIGRLGCKLSLLLPRRSVCVVGVVVGLIRLHVYVVTLLLRVICGICATVRRSHSFARRNGLVERVLL